MAPFQRPKDGPFQRLSFVVDAHWARMAGGRAEQQVLADREVVLAAVRPSTRWGRGGVALGVQCVGRSEELVDEFFAVSVERRITHPCVVAITSAARGQLFG